MRRWHVIENLIKEHGWTRGAELGVFKGDTFLWLLEHCPTLTLIGVDLWQPQPDKEALRPEGGRSYAAFDLDEFHSTVCARAAHFGHRAIIYKGATVDVAEVIADASLDFVFIDADHTETGVRADIGAWCGKIRAGGWLTGHDYNARDFPGVVRAVDDLCRDVKTFDDHVWAARV